jgi:hypothetical protein
MLEMLEMDSPPTLSVPPHLTLEHRFISQQILRIITSEMNYQINSYADKPDPQGVGDAHPRYKTSLTAYYFQTQLESPSPTATEIINGTELVSCFFNQSRDIFISMFTLYWKCVGGC